MDEMSLDMLKGGQAADWCFCHGCFVKFGGCGKSKKKEDTTTEDESELNP